MQKVIQLESKAFAAGGNVQISLKPIPPRTRIRQLFLSLEAIFNTGAAAALISGQELFRYFGNVEIQGEQGSLVKGTGQYFNTLGWLMRGAQDYLPASVPATNSSAFRRHVRVVVPFYDGLAWSPADLCPNSETFNDSVISVDFGALSAATNGSTLSSITGTLRCWAVIDDTNGQAPSLARYGYSDFATKTMVLDPGLYTHVWAFKEDASVFTNAEVSQLAIRADGSPVVTTAAAEELAYTYDFQHPSGGAFRSLSATAPVAGEQLTDEPANTAGAAATVSPEFLPLIFPCHGYKLTHAVEVNQGLQIDSQGSLSSFRIGWRRVDARNEASAVQALQKAGVPVVSAAQIRAKTESKAPLSGGKNRWTRFFPIRGA